MKVAAIVPSAGSGRRMRSSIDKPFIKLCKKEIICYALKILEDSPVISEIIVAAKGKNISRMKRLIRREGFKKVKDVTAGGKKRSRSVFNALSKVSPDVDYVLVHDSARPFITPELIRETVKAAKRYGVSLSAVKISPTVKEAGIKEGLVKRTLDRRFLWEAQTPQVIKRDILIAAYKKIGKDSGSFTDEASLAEKAGRAVKIVKGNYSNIKITRPQDLVIAEAMLKNSGFRIK